MMAPFTFAFAFMPYEAFDMNPATPKASEQFLADKGLQRAKNDRAWDWLRDIADNVRTYMSSPALLIPMLGDERLQANVIGQGKAKTLEDLFKRLGTDVKTYTTRFQLLYGKHSQRAGNSYDPDDAANSIMISQEYLQFMSSYESVVLVTVLEIIEIFQSAGLDTSSVAALTNGEFVYKLYDVAPSPGDDA
jgi:hypothetical protein